MAFFQGCCFQRLQQAAFLRRHLVHIQVPTWTKWNEDNREAISVYNDRIANSKRD
jgi:hypothetical protein